MLSCLEGGGTAAAGGRGVGGISLSETAAEADRGKAAPAAEAATAAHGGAVGAAAATDFLDGFLSAVAPAAFGRGLATA